MKISRNILLEVSENFQTSITNIDGAIRRNLELLITSLNFDRAAVFLLDEHESVLQPRQIVTKHGEMEGEGESYVRSKKAGNLSVAINNLKEVVCPGAPEYAVYIPLSYNKKRLGVLRVDNFITQKELKASQVDSLRNFSTLFSVGIYNIINHQHQKHQVDKLTTLTQIGTAIATTLKLGEVLELALSSLVKDLGYDRAQVYLLDDTNKIRENLSIDFRGYFKSLEDASNIAYIFDNILYDNKPRMPLRKFSSDLITYVPIYCKGRKTGLLIVDNLFSRQPLTSHDLSFLSILADQLSTVIENSRLFEKVEKLSITDSLTGLFNHRFFYERLSEEISRASRFGSSLSLLMIDIDNFKNFNDTFGHQAGDTVLSTVSKIIQDNIRAIDVASRYGGEEIAIILPGTDTEGAMIIAERIRQSIRNHDFRMNLQSARITISIGLVCYPLDATIKSELVNKADKALYWVKKHGKDGVCAYSKCDELGD
ncbi:MAG: sensor domain-containing diguanylate cyclase [Endomicrobiales bacterium]|nr:sensor domain-containing diguanylate cyclase [Endomicrobiales bacterium]